MMHQNHKGKEKAEGHMSSKLEAAMREVYTNEPSTVTRAKVSGKRKEKMLRAIAFSKARKAGAKLPFKPGSTKF